MTRAKAATAPAPDHASAPALAIETWPIDRVTPYGKNPRVISQSAIDKVAASIQAYGFRQPLVVDRKGVIIVGHTRHAAALQLGLTEVPVHVAKDMTAAQAKAYRLADNRTGQETSWADDLLAIELSELKAMDIDLSATGFSDIDLETLFGDPVIDPADAWQGMPEYEHEDQNSVRKIVVHFATMDDFHAFAALIGQDLTDKVKSIWYPEAEIGRYADKRYAVEGEASDDEP